MKKPKLIFESMARVSFAFILVSSIFLFTNCSNPKVTATGDMPAIDIPCCCCCCDSSSANRGSMGPVRTHTWGTTVSIIFSGTVLELTSGNGVGGADISFIAEGNDLLNNFPAASIPVGKKNAFFTCINGQIRATNGAVLVRASEGNHTSDAYLYGTWGDVPLQSNGNTIDFKIDPIPAAPNTKMDLTITGAELKYQVDLVTAKSATIRVADALNRTATVSQDVTTLTKFPSAMVIYDAAGTTVLKIIKMDLTSFANNGGTVHAVINL